MANKPKPAKPANDEQELDLSQVYQADPLNASLEKLYAEMGISGDIEANVYVDKVDEITGKERRVWEGPPDSYDLNGLSKRFGSGDYLVKVYVRRETDNRFGIKGQRVFSILLDPAEDARIEAIRNPSSVSLQSGSPQITAETIAAAIKQAMPTPAPDSLGMLKSLADIMKTLMPAQPIAQTPDYLGLIKMVKEILPSGSSDPIERGVNASGMDVFLKLAEHFAPAIAKTVMDAKGASPALNAPANAQPSAEDDNVLQLRMGLNFLVKQAEVNADPITYAGVVIDNVPGEVVDQLVNNPEWLAYLSQFDNRVIKNKKWFEELRGAVIEEIKAIAADAEIVNKQELTPGVEQGKK